MSSIDDIVALIQANYEMIQKEIKRTEERLEVVDKQLRYEEEASRIIQIIAKQVQDSVHKEISEVVTRCLQMVFDDTYTFEIVFEIKRGKTEARMVFKQGDMEINPMTTSGGMVDVASFALRIACLCVMPNTRKLLITDEAFKYISEGNKHKIASLLETVSTELGIQIIQVTHIRELEIGKVVQL